ncbi:MAG: hypothetical protein IJI03_20010, partial [Rudaea sp.]|nr:hypothetical protein [Rudaea sp.]
MNADSELYARLRELYDSVVDIEPTARAEALARQGIVGDLAAEVLALCAADDRDRTGALTGVRDRVFAAAAAPQPAIGEV